MPVKDLLNLSVISKKKASSTGDPVEAWANVNTALKCCIFPATYSDRASFSQNDYLRTTISHKMYCLSSEDLKTGYKIVNGEDEYLVKRALPWSHSGIKYLKVYLAEIK